MPTRHPPVEGSWSAGPSPVARRLAVPLREFLDTEVAGGLVRLAATAVAHPTMPELQDQARVGILAGSLLAAAVGAVLLHRSLPPSGVLGRGEGR